MFFKIPTLDQGKVLAELFRNAGFTVEGAQQVFSTESLPLPNAVNIVPMLERTAEATRLNIFLRWFRIGYAVPFATAESAIDPQGLQLLVDCGMIHARDGNWIPAMMLTPYCDLLIASDNHDRLHDSLPDYVLSLSPTAKHLYDFAIRKECELALDLCAGCGLHAVGLAAHSSHVMASDFNERAELFVQFNAAINGFANVESVSGDGFSPVVGKKFDLIACNPPFVVSPSKEFLYRDNGLDIDDFVRNLFQQAPDYLRSGGFFQAIFEWVEIKGQGWQQRLKTWFEDRPCNVLVLKANSELPQSYAKRRVHEMRESDSDKHEAEIAEWLDYYDKFQVRGIHGGLIAIQKTDSPGWCRFEEMSSNHKSSYGDYVLAVFEAEDFLRNTTPESIISAKLRLTPDLRLLQQSTAENGRWNSLGNIVAFSEGWHPVLTVDANIAQLLPLFDGQRTVGELNEVFANLVDAGPLQTLADFSEGVREFLRRGVLRIAPQTFS